MTDWSSSTVAGAVSDAGFAVTDPDQLDHVSDSFMAYAVPWANDARGPDVRSRVAATPLSIFARVSPMNIVKSGSYAAPDL